MAFGLPGFAASTNAAPEPEPAEPEAPLPLPSEAGAYQSEYLAGLKAAEDKTEQMFLGLNIAYVEKLRQLQYSLQLSGRLKDLIAVHDELIRFRTQRTPPAPTPTMEPPELRILAEEQVRALRTAQYSNDVHVARAASTYIQNLALLRRILAEKSGPDILVNLDAERDRLLTNAAIRQAVVGSLTSPDSLTNLISTVDSMGPTANESDRLLRLYRPGNEPAATIMGYSLDVGMTEDTSRMRQAKSDGKQATTVSQSGNVAYQFRVTVVGRNSEVPSGSRIVIEYFQRSLTDSAKSYVSSEQSLLPGVGKGETYTVEFKGVSLYKSESSSSGSRGWTRSFSGHEFHGVIVSLLDPEGRIILQRFHPQSMSREVNATPGIR